jgi:protein-S-isoprenylcysteine O-methyltransferase Ste14
MKNENEITLGAAKDLKKRIFIKFSLFPLSIGLLILLPSGTLKFWYVYTYMIIIVIPMTFALIYFFKRNPKFLERRIRKKEKEKPQKYVVWFSTIGFVLGFLTPGFDFRFGWSNVPIAVIIIAHVLVLSGYLVIFLVFKENSYASNIIEVNEHQIVISTGPYKFIRHPMYFGFLLMFLSTPIALASYWAVIPFLILPVSIILRIINEEKVLSENLQGYKEYCRKTRYRLIPRIW